MFKLPPGLDPDVEIDIDKMNEQELRELLRQLMADIVNFDDPEMKRRARKIFHPSNLPRLLQNAALAQEAWRTFCSGVKMTPDNVRRASEMLLLCIGLIDFTPEISEDLKALPSLPDDD